MPSRIFHQQNPNLKSLSTRIGYVFTQPSLLMQALRHRSAGTPHNERLEFLGDGIVNFFVAHALFERWPTVNEGVLTRARAELVKEAALAALARDLQLGDALILGPGELKSGGRRRDSILADAFEALVGAIFLDSGCEICRQVVMPWFATALASLPVGTLVKDPKTRLQEWLQARQYPLPRYALVDELGDEHAKQFQVQCTLTEPALMTMGQGSSRRLAEQQAALAVIDQLEGKL